jgi:choline dehydrogenase-like flavoprotein
MRRQHGVHSLRVVHAHIMPLQVGAHIQATLYVIAEKTADIIIDDYLLEIVLYESHGTCIK